LHIVTDHAATREQPPARHKRYSQGALPELADKMNCRAHFISWRRERGPRAGAEGWSTIGDERALALPGKKALLGTTIDAGKLADRIAPLTALKPD
jgi:hypothetical protein